MCCYVRKWQWLFAMAFVISASIIFLLFRYLLKFISISVYYDDKQSLLFT